MTPKFSVDRCRICFADLILYCIWKVKCYRINLFIKNFSFSFCCLNISNMRIEKIVANYLESSTFKIVIRAENTSSPRYITAESTWKWNFCRFKYVYVVEYTALLQEIFLYVIRFCISCSTSPRNEQTLL